MIKNNPFMKFYRDFRIKFQNHSLTLNSKISFQITIKIILKINKINLKSEKNRYNLKSLFKLLNKLTYLSKI